MREKLIGIIADCCSLSMAEIKDDSLLWDLVDRDSLDLIHLGIDIEAEMGIQLSQKEMYSVTVGDVLKQGAA